MGSIWKKSVYIEKSRGHSFIWSKFVRLISGHLMITFLIIFAAYEEPFHPPAVLAASLIRFSELFLSLNSATIDFLDLVALTFYDYNTHPPLLVPFVY